MRCIWTSAIGAALIVSVTIPIVTSVSAAASPTVVDGRRLYPTVEQAEGAMRAAAPSPQLRYAGGREGIGVTIGPPQVYVVFWGAQCEKCVFRNPPPGTWYVDVGGFTDFTELRLKVRMR